MNVVLDFVTWHDGIPFALFVSCLILTAVLIGVMLRDRRREIEAENEAGIYCRHGKYRYHSCRSCAEEFAAEVRAENESAQDQRHDENHYGEATPPGPELGALPSASPPVWAALATARPRGMKGLLARQAARAARKAMNAAAAKFLGL